MTDHMSARLVLDAKSQLGEGPVWDSDRGVLWWVDSTRCIVHRYDPRSGSDQAIGVPEQVGAVALRRGGLLIALARELAVLDPEHGRIRPLLRFADDPWLRCNDGKCDAMGRLWVGRMSVGPTRRPGSLLRVDPDLTVTEVLKDLTLPNGLGWSPDGALMYFLDSYWGELRAYPYDMATGGIGQGAVLSRFATDGTLADGLTVDGDGSLWVALWGGGAIIHLAPDGTRLGAISVPTSNVTSCTFGGPGLGDLYITTAAVDRDARPDRLAGALFVCQPGVRGLPAAGFAG